VALERAPVIYVARRIGWSVAVVWVVVSLTFAINELLPGDPARMVAGLQARPADVARIREQLGLGRPPFVRYALFLRRLVHVGPRTTAGASDPKHGTCAVVLGVGDVGLHLDLGKSFQMRKPVVDVVAERLPRTFALAAAAVFVQLLLGVATGTIAAALRGTRWDRFLVSASLLGISLPTYLLALLLQAMFARQLRILPLDGYGQSFAEHARCIVLPAVTLGIFGAAYYTRLVRDEMAALLRRDWVRTARAKGANAFRVVTVHALRNATPPVLTAVALDFGALLGGAIVTESVFRWPGLGELSVRATLDRDGPVLMACVLVASFAVVVTNLLVDLAYARLDPRITDPRARDNR
jgi:peptide/nickel transport system permease protein